MRSLITGICGFAGSHLAELLLGEGDEVAGLALPGEERRNIGHLLGRVAVLEADIGDEAGVARVVREAKPEVIYHLAGMASVGQAWRQPGEALRVNAAGLVNLVLAGRENGNPALLAVGSGEMYGRVAEERQPIGEETPCAPVSPYALSKVWQEEAALFYHRVFDYPVVILRPFNHTGPRQSRLFVCSDFAAQIAEIEAGKKPPVIKVGNLSARRDFLDVRDVAAAYRLAVMKGRRGVPYNVATGRAWAIGDILDLLRGMCRVKVEVRREEERLRPADIPLLCGDRGLLAADTGWAPRYPLSRTLADLLDHWRAAASKEAARC